MGGPSGGEAGAVDGWSFVESRRGSSGEWWAGTVFVEYSGGLHPLERFVRGEVVDAVDTSGCGRRLRVAADPVRVRGNVWGVPVLCRSVGEPVF